jgi:hypothetical protein
LVSIAALLFVSCKAPGAGTFTPDRFAHARYSYEVRYFEHGPENLLGADWRLDNYVWAKGAPKKEKQGDDYVIHRQYDMNDDGEVDTKADEQYYDLLLEHRRKDAAIWLRSAPISNHDRSKELSVFADNYVEAASGSEGVLVQFGAGGPVGSVSKRFASRVLSRSACTVSGVPAYRVDFEIANVDQLQLTPDARWVRSRIVLVQTPFLHAPNRRFAKQTLPVVMLAGLRASPDDFETLAADFDRMLDRIVIGGTKQAVQHAAAVPHTCRADVAPPVASAPAGIPASAPSAAASAEAPSAAPASDPAAPASADAPLAPAPVAHASAAAPPAPAPATSGSGAPSPATPPPATKPGAPKKRDISY